MEFLRFGSSIPGGYWGCCAADIIQNFKVDPDAKASIQMVSGDGGYPVTDAKGKALYAGPTYRDIFWQRLRVGTFNTRDMPNHAFFAILTSDQLKGDIGRKWLGILREAGFEFLRSVSNSVYAGQSLANPSGNGSSLNHIFALFRNIGAGAPADPFTPPAEWTKLTVVTPEVWSSISDNKKLVKAQSSAQRAVWDAHPLTPFLTEDDLVKAGAPVTFAGLRSKFPPQEKSVREKLQSAENNGGAKKSDPFAEAEAA